MTRVHPDTLTPPSNGLVVETKKGGKEESPANEALDSPVRDGPARAVGDRVLLALSLEEFQNFRNGTLEKNINGLNAGELAEITFANLEYGNYKVKRDSDDINCLACAKPPCNTTVIMPPKSAICIAAVACCGCELKPG